MHRSLQCVVSLPPEAPSAALPTRSPTVCVCPRQPNPHTHAPGGARTWPAAGHLRLPLPPRWPPICPQYVHAHTCLHQPHPCKHMPGCSARCKGCGCFQRRVHSRWCYTCGFNRNCDYGDRGDLHHGNVTHTVVWHHTCMYSVVGGCSVDGCRCGVCQTNPW